MKKRIFDKIFLLLIFSAFQALVSMQPVGAQPVLAQQAYKVSNNPSLAHILIEEFTAIHCSFCPSAHTVSNNLSYLFPERIHVLAVHTSRLADPDGDEVDFRTEWGQRLQDLQGSSGMPSGNINRTYYGSEYGVGGYAVPYNSWNKLCKKLIGAKDTADVNLWVEANYNSQTKLITMTVEGYLINNTIDTLNLHVAITENFVHGTQMGSGVSEYLHRHVLRYLQTGVEGEGIYSFENGYFRRTYEYSLPEMFNNRAPKLPDLSCLVFVANKKGEVLNTQETKIITSEKSHLDYLLLDMKRIGQKYGSPDYDIFLVNPSDDTISSLKFEFTFNNKKEEYLLENLSCAPRTETIVKLKSNFKEWKSTNIYKLTLKEANGKEVQANNVSGSYKMADSLPESVFKIRFTTDKYGSENTISVKDKDGKILSTMGPFKDNEVKTYISEPIQTEKGNTYTIDIEDSFKDGMEAEGKVELITESGEVFYTGGLDYYGSVLAYNRPDVVSSEKISDLEIEYNVSLCPNPAKDITKLSLKGFNPGVVDVDIYNLQGVKKDSLKIKVSANSLSECILNLQEYEGGLYLVRVAQKNEGKVLKLLIRK